MPAGKAGRTRRAALGSGQGARPRGLLFSLLRFPGSLQRGGGWLLQSISKRRNCSCRYCHFSQRWERQSLPLQSHGKRAACDPRRGSTVIQSNWLTRTDPPSPAVSLCVLPSLQSSSFLEKSEIPESIPPLSSPRLHPPSKVSVRGSGLSGAVLAFAHACVCVCEHICT